MVIFAGAMMTSANGQTLNNILTKISNASGKNGETVSSVLDNLIGTKKVSATSLVGKWVYSKPAVAFESQNALSKVGGSVVSSKMETKLNEIFTKAGIKKGKFSVTFAKDGTFTSVVNNRTMKGVYTLNGSSIVFARTSTAKLKITANVKLGTTLQITFKADKLLQFVQQFGSVAGSSSTTLSTISTLAKNYSGMQVGMHYTR